MIFVDSNIWIYYLNEAAPEHRFVKEPMRRLISTEEMVSNTVIVLEIAHYFRFLPASDLRRILDSILGLSTLRILDVDRSLMDASLRFLQKYADLGVGGRDATILASLDLAGTNRLITHDNVFKRLKFIETIDPVPERP